MNIIFITGLFFGSEDSVEYLFQGHQEGGCYPLKLNIHPQFKNPQFYFIILGDTFLFALSLYLSFLFRFEFAPGHLWMKQMFGLLVWVVPLKLIFFFFRVCIGECGATPACMIFGCWLALLSYPQWSLFL